MPASISAWTETDLRRFIENTVRQSPSALPRSLNFSELHVAKKLVVEDLLELSPQAIDYLRTKLGL